MNATIVRGLNGFGVPGSTTIAAVVTRDAGTSATADRQPTVTQAGPSSSPDANEPAKPPVAPSNASTSLLLKLAT